MATTPKQPNIPEIETSFHHHHMSSQQQSIAPKTPENQSLSHRAVNFPNNDPIVPSTPPPPPHTTSPRIKLESTIKMKKTQISQSLLARTRSRAEVEAISPINSKFSFY